jgi:hypothetical protein
MKKLITFIGLIILSFSVNGQKDFNPFESIGKEGKMLTLSNGKYMEVEMYDSLQRIGSVIINRNTGEIHELLPIDDTSEFRYDPTTFSRWYSLDPVVKAHESPYAGFSNNPIWFIDPNGSDTANYTSTINSAHFKGAEMVANMSQAFKKFLSDFTSEKGKYHDIKLEFKAVENLKSADGDAAALGQARLMYKGKWVQDLTSLPANAKLSDFSILVELNSNISSPSKGQSGSGDEIKALKTVTLIHELLLHASGAADILNNNRITDSDGKTTGIKGENVISNYKDAIQTDHPNLYVRKAQLYNVSYTELINHWRATNAPTQKVPNPSVNYPSRAGWGEQKKKANPTLQLYELLWQQFENDINPLTIGK